MTSARVVPLLMIALVACAPRSSESARGGDTAPVTVADACAQRRNDAPAIIASVTPDSVRLTASLDPVTLELHGCGFEPSANDVMFGPQLVRAGVSYDGGTRIRFTMPYEIRGGDEVPPMPIQPGSYDIVVLTRHGRSNVRAVTLY